MTTNYIAKWIVISLKIAFAAKKQTQHIQNNNTMNSDIWTTSNCTCCCCIAVKFGVSTLEYFYKLSRSKWKGRINHRVICRTEKKYKQIE